MKTLQIFIITTIVCINQIYSKLFVQSPESLKLQFPEGMNSSMANFGFYNYGHTQSGHLLSTGTDEWEKDNKYACKPLQPPPFEIDETHPHSFQFFVMAERGNCTFLQKAQNAEAIGATLLIVADDEPNDIVESHILVGKQADAETGAPHVRMPTIMISKQNSDIIRQTYTNDPISMNFKMDRPNRTDVVNMELWFTPFEQQSDKFFRHYKQVFESLQGKIKFTPRYYMTYCYLCEKQYNYQIDEASGDCISGGRYCAQDPDIDGPLTGADVVAQMERSLCLFNVVDQLDWMEIQIYFYNQCINKRTVDEDFKLCWDRSLTEGLISLQKKDIKSTLKNYDSCISSSKVQNNAVEARFWDHSILAEQREQILINDVMYSPLLKINGMVFNGDLEEIVPSQEMMCESFSDKSRPQQCDDVARHWWYNDYRESEILQEQSSPVLLVIGIILVALLVILVFLFCFRRQMRKGVEQNMHQQVQSSVNNYFTLADKSSARNDSENF